MVMAGRGVRRFDFGWFQVFELALPFGDDRIGDRIANDVGRGAFCKHCVYQNRKIRR